MVAASRRSVLALAVLSMLSEEPMHVYRMAQLIKERHKDDVVNVTSRNSVYQTVERLLRDEQVAVSSTGREENRPERTVYKLTAAGRKTLARWLQDMLAVPAGEFPEFPAALSFMASIDVDAAVAALRRRVTALEAKRDELTATLAEVAPWLERVFLVETEYALDIVAVELAYTQRLVGDLESGRVTWPHPSTR